MSPEKESSSLGIRWNEVTWYSKLAALFVFVVLMPTVAFYIGEQYELNREVQMNLVALEAQNAALENSTVGILPLQPGESYTASTTDPDFQTFMDTDLGFSIDIPKVAYTNVSGCVYVTNNDSNTGPTYEYTYATTSVPLEVQTIGNTDYIDFAYQYELIQKPNTPDYPQCIKQSIAEYLANNDGGGTAPAPISVIIDPATSTSVAESIALKEGQALMNERDCPYSLVAKPSAQEGVFDLTAQLPSNFTQPSDGYQCSWPLIVKYSPQDQKVATIFDGSQQCIFLTSTLDYSSYSPADCYDATIDNSFKFIQ